MTESYSNAIPVDPARTDQFMNVVFRVERYATNYAGLLGRDLTPQGTIELPVDQYRHQPKHRHVDLIHRNQRHPPEPTPGLVSSHPLALTHGLVKAR